MVMKRSFFKVYGKNQWLCMLISSFVMLTVESFGRMLSSKKNINLTMLYLGKLYLAWLGQLVIKKDCE